MQRCDRRCVFGMPSPPRSVEVAKPSAEASAGPIHDEAIAESPSVAEQVVGPQDEAAARPPGGAEVRVPTKQQGTPAPWEFLAPRLEAPARLAAAVSIQAAAGDLAPKLAAASAEPLVSRSPDASARDDVAPGAMPGGRSTMTASVKGGGNTAQGPCVELSCRSAPAKSG